MKRYRMYIDESGSAELCNFKDMNKYLTLTGIIISENNKIELHNRLNILKKEIFNYDIDVDKWSLHKSDAIGKKHFYRVLQDEKINTKFENMLIEIFSDTDMKIISVTLDKEAAKRKYKEKTKHPYHYVFEVLMKRYLFFLEENNANGDVLIEGRTPPNNRQMEECYRNIYRNGVGAAFGGNPILPHRFKKRLTSTEIKIKDKRDNIAGLQIADWLTSVFRNYALTRNGFEKEIRDRSLLWKRIIDVVLPKTYSHNNKVDGLGVVFINYQNYIKTKKRGR